MGGVHLKPKRLGEKLRQIRLALGLSQSEMLKRLGYEDDIWYTQISAYENGNRQPPLLVLLEYARIANISTDVLIDDKRDLPAKLTNERRRR
jgi:transcriptional regulator with XRE-family HTH domain